MAYLINIGAEPNQEFEVILSGQKCSINLYQRAGRLYLDLTADGAVIIRGAVCYNNTDILQYRHAGFLGNLRFWDTESANDPVYSGIGTRFRLYYIPPEEGDELREFEAALNGY